MNLLRFGYLQALWWMALLWRDPVQSVGVFLLYLALEYNFGVLKKCPKQYALFSLLVTFYGFCTETLFIATNWVDYGTEVLPPLWLIIFWPMFVGYYDWAFDFFRKHKIFSACFASVAGPVVYYGVSQQKAISFFETLPALMYLALSWAIFFPLSLWAFEKIYPKSLYSERP